nr:hypothetical protein [uncultured bacterium]
MRHGSLRADGTVDRPRSPFAPRFHRDGRLDGEQTNATRARFGNHHQPVRRNGVDPATNSVPGEVFCPGIIFEVVERRESRAEHQHAGATRQHSAVVAGSDHAPRHRLTGKRMFAHLLRAGVEIVAPRFGDDLIFDYDRAVPVIGVFRPELVPVISRKCDEPSMFEFSFDKLFPVVAVGVRTAKEQHVVLKDESQLTAAGADFAAIGDVDRLRPDLLARPRVERDSEPLVLLFHLGFDFFRFPF